MRTMLTEYLAGVGLEAVTAVDGQDALEKVRSEAPDAVILDLMMPVMGGLGFLKKLRKDPLHTGLPVFVLTGKAVTDAESELLGELASAVLLKEDAPSCSASSSDRSSTSRTPKGDGVAFSVLREEPSCWMT